MNPILIKLLPMAIAAGLVVGNAGAIEQFYHDVIAHTQYVTNGMDMRNVGMMLDAEYLRTGRYPAEKQFPAWMRATFKESKNRDIAVDSWGTPFRYTTAPRGKGFHLVSAGPDREYDTEDDLVYTGP